MSTNQGPEYFAAEKHYLQAKTDDERIYWLEEMIKNFKKHKSSESMLANIKQRLKRFQEQKEKKKKVGKSSKKGIKKEGYQVVLVGLTNSGKSSLLAKLTNAQPKISSNQFTTKEPEVGVLYHKDIKVQIIDCPSIGSEFFDIGSINGADCLLIVVSSLKELEKIQPYLSRATKKRIVAINKSDLLTEDEIRKINETMKSKHIPGIPISCYTEYNLENLKDLIVKDTGFIRIYTKEPGKPYSPDPVMLKSGSTIKDVAESIRNNFSLQVKEIRITGPSSKFPNQKVGLSHILRDLDIVEFHTR